MRNLKEPIRVWKWEHAPDEFRALSPHGGDEDWVAHIPPAMFASWIPWLESGTHFGCCDVSRHQLPDGSEIRIGAHA